MLKLGVTLNATNSSDDKELCASFCLLKSVMESTISFTWFWDNIGGILRYLVLSAVG